MSEEKERADVNGDNGGSKIVKGDEIKIGSIGSMTGSVVGSGHVQAQTIAGGDALTQLFQDVYQRIENRPEDPNVDKKELAETVQEIEQEAGKGDKANPSKVERWLHFLGEMAPDILDVTVACLVDPIAGVATVTRKIAEKARADARSASAQA